MLSQRAELLKVFDPHGKRPGPKLEVYALK
jgi:hypothetical protein